ncbi:MAG TPA: hypothetical protein PLD23_12470 [Armatimonadota bacterium]|nr:hypothetical protein [Armatimonadota bacterium]
MTGLKPETPATRHELPGRGPTDAIGPEPVVEAAVFLHVPVEQVDGCPGPDGRVIAPACLGAISVRPMARR